VHIHEEKRRDRTEAIAARDYSQENWKPTNHLTFADLEVGEHFDWGGKEHVKLPEIESGFPPMSGIVNNIEVGTLNLSGMGPGVPVKRWEEPERIDELTALRELAQWIETNCADGMTRAQLYFARERCGLRQAA
jgi:hypothetical protein